MEYSDPTLGESEPDRLWSRTNVMEATPEVMSPLCWTTWVRGMELGGRRAYAQLGIMPLSQVKLPDSQNDQLIGCFYGRQAMNIDFFRSVFGVIPGVDPDALVRQAFAVDSTGRGRIRAEPARLASMIARAPVALGLEGARLRRLHRESSAWWRRDVLGSGATGRELLVAATRRFEDGLQRQTFARISLGGPTAQLQAAGERIGRPDLALRAGGGFGGVAENALMDDLWLVSRGDLERDEFIRRHGFHGPSEGNPIGRSWRENPDLIDNVAKQLGQRPDDERPAVRLHRTRVDAAEAVKELLAHSPRSRRPGIRATVSMTAGVTRRVEIGKSCFLMGIDGIRKAARDLGAALCQEGVLDRTDDPFFLTYDELIRPLPADVRDLVAFRRTRRQHYASLELPLSFTGVPLSTSGSDPATDSGTVELVGVGASAGRVVGRACVVRDPSDVELEPGDVLVCHITDPGWSALFTLADAVVTDVGGQASHGAILARELGLPCVVGTVNATRTIRDGDTIEVDGSAGTIRIHRS